MMIVLNLYLNSKVFVQNWTWIIWKKAVLTLHCLTLSNGISGILLYCITLISSKQTSQIRSLIIFQQHRVKYLMLFGFHIYPWFCNLLPNIWNTWKLSNYKITILHYLERTKMIVIMLQMSSDYECGWAVIIFQ